MKMRRSEIIDNLTKLVESYRRDANIIERGIKDLNPNSIYIRNSDNTYSKETDKITDSNTNKFISIKTKNDI